MYVTLELRYTTLNFWAYPPTLDNKIFMILLSNFTLAFFTCIVHTHVVDNACIKSKVKLDDKIKKI
jgi:hypothetical protein